MSAAADNGSTVPPLPRIALAPDLTIPRIVTGLWQVADQERSGAQLDPERGADSLAAYAAAGFDAYDMADHYGSAEIIAGRLLSRPVRRGASGRAPSRSGARSPAP